MSQTLNDRVPLAIIAACRFHAAAGGEFGFPAFIVQRGFAAAFTRNGAGDYSLTLTTPCAAAELHPVPSIIAAQDANGAHISVVSVSATEVRVTTSGGAGLADLDFGLVLLRRLP